MKEILIGLSIIIGGVLSFAIVSTFLGYILYRIYPEIIDKDDKLGSIMMGGLMLLLAVMFMSIIIYISYLTGKDILS